MTFTESIKGIFRKNNNKKTKDNSDKSKSKAFMSKLSSSFLIPIAVMSIAGLFIGIGAAVGSSGESSTIKIISGFFGGLGWPVFNSLPLLFAVAIIIGFTDDIGTAVFGGIIGFLIFNAIQTPFINTISAEGVADKVYILGIHTPDDIATKMTGIVGNILGITSLSTSVFGGIVVGFISVYAYKKLHKIKLPTIISFYGGKRFVAIAIMILMIPLAFLFLLIWPWIGIGLAYFGEYSGKVAGLDSFIVNFIERATVPFGLHYILSTALNFTDAGGNIANQFDLWSAVTGNIVVSSGNTIFESNAAFINQIIKDGDNYVSISGDRNGWLAVIGSPFTKVTYVSAFGGEQTLPILDFFNKEVGINLGRFQMTNIVKEFPLPAAALAMVMAAPKERRKEALSICLPAAFSAFFVGITEPIEFTFLFLAPALFWGFHCVMAAFLALFANLLGIHYIGFGGFLDDITFGMINVAKGTNFWWTYVLSIAAAPIYFGVFYWAIKRFNLSTPGRGASTGFITKKVYKELKAKSKNNKTSTLSQKGKNIISALGGWNNIVEYKNCASRLRYDIKDKNLINESALKDAGTYGIVWQGDNHIQIIVGTIAEQLNNDIKKYIGISLN